MKRVQHGICAIWKQKNMKRTQHGKVQDEKNATSRKLTQKKCNTKKVKHECNMKRVKKFKLKENMKCEKNGDTLTLFRMGLGKYYPT